MVTEFPIKLAITLTPRLDKTVPNILIGVPGQVHRVELFETRRIELEFSAATGWVEVVFNNKSDTDSITAVIVDKVEFFGVSDPRFVWAGVYTPKYPEPWYSQQTPRPPAQLPQQSYMGWNGTWRLDFEVPVFTWMHKILDWGWIYQ